MKKIIALLLLFSLCLSLCACGKSPAVKNVEALIDGIGQVTAEKENAVISAEEAYNALTVEEKDTVDNYTILTTARKDLNKALFIERINDIHESDDNFAKSVVDSFNEYEKLPADEQEDEEILAAYNTLMEHYATLYSKLSGYIEEINTHLEACEMEQVYTKSDEAIAFAKQLEQIPVTADIDEVNKRFSISTISEVIALLEESKENVISLCYADTFVMRFEYHEDFPESKIESLEKGYSYGYTTGSYLREHYNSYINYLKDNYSSRKVDDDELAFDLGDGKQLMIKKAEIPSWGFHAIWVYPPVVD